MLSEKIGSFYAGVEDKWYGFLDALDAKGIPVYGYVDALENRGIPSLPFTIGVLLLVIALAFGLLFVGGRIDAKVNISIADDLKASLSGVKVTVFDNVSGDKLGESAVSGSGAIELKGIPVGTAIRIVGEKSGYKSAEASAAVTSASIPVRLSLEKNRNLVNAKIVLVDSGTQDRISGAQIVAEWDAAETTFQAIPDGNGSFVLNAVPENEELLVSISADGYEDLQQPMSFSGNEERSVPLSPRSVALQGTSKLIVSVFDDSTKELVKGAKVTVKDKEKDIVVSDTIAADGTAVLDVERGVSARIIVSKDGYLEYDSLLDGKALTIRKGEEQFEVQLKKGGEKLSVTAYSNSIPLPDVIVQVFDANGTTVLASKPTGFGGLSEFSGLEPGKKLVVTGFIENYLPVAEKVDLATAKEARLNLVPVSGQNASTLEAYIKDSDGVPANNATVSFYEILPDETVLPLGIPALTADVAGFASVRAPVNKTILVKAKRGIEEGDGRKTIEANKRNAVRITLQKSASVAELILVDADGLPLSGTISIISANGENVFDGNIENGKVLFDNRGKKDFSVQIKTPDGKTLAAKVSLDEQNSAEVRAGDEGVSGAAGIEPEIRFVRILNERNQPVQGIVPGKFYWLEFEAKWPGENFKSGIHFRAGPDNVKFVDAQDTGIYGYDATGAKAAFGSTYNATPSPGNEGVDRKNLSRPGQPGKWLELSFDKPADTAVIRVKVMLKPGSQAKETEFHYRAWAVGGPNYFRDPEDSVLGGDEFNRNRLGLYAETKTLGLLVFESDALCQGPVCLTYKFVADNGAQILPQDFKPAANRKFALEIGLLASEPASVTVKADTSKTDPKLFFTGSAKGTAENFPDTNGNETSIEVSGISVAGQESAKASVFFRTVAGGSASIKTQVIAGQAVVPQEFSFNIFEEKGLDVSVRPETILAGESFTVSVKDAQTLKSVENALVQLKDDRGRVVASVAGNSGIGSGRNGEFLFRGAFTAGAYTAEVSAEGYSPKSLAMAIGGLDSLQLTPQEITLSINKQTKEASAFIALRNLSRYGIENISYEMVPGPGFPQEIQLTASVPESLAQSQSSQASVSAKYSGPESASLFGEADIIVKGLAGGRQMTGAKGRIKVYYNKSLPSGCLRLDRESLQAYLLGTAGANKNLDLQVENRCGTDLELQAKVLAKKNDPALQVLAQPITLKKDETKTFTITLSNRVERFLPQKEERQFTVILESDSIAKSVPLKVVLWDSRFSIASNDTIVLFLSHDRQAQKATAAAQLHVENVSPFEIRALSFSVSPMEIGQNGITLDVMPKTAGLESLKPGQVLLPPRFVIAETGQDKSFDRPLRGQIIINGATEESATPVQSYPYGFSSPALAGQSETFDPAQQYGYNAFAASQLQAQRISSLETYGGGLPRIAFKSIDVWANVSGFKCLKAFSDDTAFESEESRFGTIAKELTIRNECAEEIRIVDIAPKEFGRNTLVLSPLATPILAPNSEAKFQLLLQKKQDYSNETGSIKAIGLLIRSQKFMESNALPFRISLGEKAVEGAGVKTSEIELPYCDADGTAKVSFPLLSQDNCSEGYCDAETAAKFLAKKMQDAVKQAQERISASSADAKSFAGCGQGKDYCTFSNMNVASTPFPVFLQNDFVTSAGIENAVKTENISELKGYKIQAGETSEQEISDIAATGLTKQVIMSKPLKGCGRYLLSVKGAVQVKNGQIIKDSFVLLVRHESERKVTGECLNAVQNVSNFLPIDKSYSQSQSFGSWPGMVQPEEGLEEIGKSFSQSLFGSEQRVARTAGGNKIVIKAGETNGSLVKLEIEKTEKSDEPKTVFATIPKVYSEKKKAESQKTGSTNVPATPPGQNAQQPATAKSQSLNWQGNGTAMLQAPGGTQTGTTAPTQPTQTQTPAAAPPAGQAPGNATQGQLPAADITINIKDLKFSPSTVNIQPGQTVEWVNNDTVEHTVTIESIGFNVKLKANEATSHTFTEEGKFDYKCTLHPGMTGTVFVAKAQAQNAGNATQPAEQTQGTALSTSGNIASEAAKAIAELTQHQVDGCISKDESYLLIKSFSQVGSLKIEGDENVTLYVGENCAQLKVVAEVPQKVRLSQDWETHEDKTGIDSVQLRSADGKEIPSTQTIELAKDAKTGNYKYDFKLCVSGNDQFVLAAQTTSPYVNVKAKSVQIKRAGASTANAQPLNEAVATVSIARLQAPGSYGTANAQTQESGSTQSAQQATGNNSGSQGGTASGASADKKPSEWVSEGLLESNSFNVKFSVCGIHPEDLLKKIVGMEPGTYYATVGWKGQPETVSLADVAKALARQKALDAANKAISTPGGPALDKQKTYKEQLNAEKRKAIEAGFLAPCSVAAAICGGMTKAGVGALWDVGLNCVLPASIAAADTFEKGEDAKAFMQRQFDGLKTWFGGKDLQGISADQLSFLDTPQSQDNRDALLDAAVGGATVRTLTRGLETLSFEQQADIVSARWADALVAKSENRGFAQFKGTFKGAMEKRILEAHRLDPKISIDTAAKNALQGSDTLLSEVGTTLLRDPQLRSLRGTPALRTNLLDQIDASARAPLQKAVGDTALPAEFNFKATGLEWDPVGQVTRDGRLITGIDATSGRPLIETAAGSGTSRIVSAAEMDQLIETAGNNIKIGGRVGAFADELTDDVMAQLKNSVSVEQAAKIDGLRAPLREQISRRLETAFSSTATAPEWDGGAFRIKAALSQDEMRRILGSSADSLDRQVVRGALFDDAALRQITESTLSGSATSALDDAAKLGRLDALKRNLRDTFSRKRFWDLAKGLGCSVLSVAAGMEGYDQWMKNMFKAPDKGIDEINGGAKEIDPETGKVLGDSLEVILKKNHTYRIVKTAKGDGGSGATTTIVEVQGAEQFSQMQEELKSGKAKRLDSDCKGEFAQRTLSTVFGSLLPTVEAGADPQEMKIYYDPEAQKAIASASDQTEVEEAAIMAAVLAEMKAKGVDAAEAEKTQEKAETKTPVTGTITLAAGQAQSQASQQREKILAPESILQTAQLLAQLKTQTGSTENALAEFAKTLDPKNSSPLAKWVVEKYQEWKRYSVVAAESAAGAGAGQGGTANVATGGCAPPKQGEKLSMLSERPCLSAEFVDQILASAGSPAAGTGKYFVQYGQQYGIDNAIALAFFKQESTYGKFGVANKTKSVGNIKCPQSTIKYDFMSGAFCGWNSWQGGIEAWFAYIKTSKHYFPQGKTTVDDILPIYAPSSENDTGAYIRNVKADVAKWRSQQGAMQEPADKKKTSAELSGNVKTVPMTNFVSASQAKSVQSNSSSRNGTRIDTIVLHHTAGGNISGALSWWADSHQASSHYIVGKQGEIVEVIPEDKKAWHANCVNGRSIGIEIVNMGNGSDSYPPAQQQAVKQLVQGLAAKYNIAEGNIIGHGCTSTNRLVSEPTGFPRDLGNGLHLYTRDGANSYKCTFKC